MRYAPSPLSPDIWLCTLFQSKAAANGGVVRRKKSDVERIYGLPAFLEQIERRGYRALENAGQIIVICNSDPIRMLI